MLPCGVQGASSLYVGEGAGMVERPKVRLQDGLQRPQGHLQLRLRRVDGTPAAVSLRDRPVVVKAPSVRLVERSELDGELLQAVNGRRNIEFLIPGIGHDLRVPGSGRALVDPLTPWLGGLGEWVGVAEEDILHGDLVVPGRLLCRHIRHGGSSFLMGVVMFSGDHIQVLIGSGVYRRSFISPR